jgi:hypothetical protein
METIHRYGLRDDTRVIVIGRKSFSRMLKKGSCVPLWRGTGSLGFGERRWIGSDPACACQARSFGILVRL